MTSNLSVITCLPPCRILLLNSLKFAKFMKLAVFLLLWIFTQLCQIIVDHLASTGRNIVLIFTYEPSKSSCSSQLCSSVASCIRCHSKLNSSNSRIKPPVVFHRPSIHSMTIPLQPTIWISMHNVSSQSKTNARYAFNNMQHSQVYVETTTKNIDDHF